MVNNGKNPFVPATSATTPTITPTTETTPSTTTPATDSGFDMDAFMKALKNPTPEPVPTPEPIQGTVTFTPPPNEQPTESTTNQPVQEGEEQKEETNTEQQEGEEKTLEPEPVPEEKKSKIMDAIKGLLDKIPNVKGLLTSTLGLAQGVESQFMKDLIDNMSKASSNNSSNKSNNNTKTLTFLILYENGANVIKNQEINVLPTLPFNITIYQTPFTLSEDGTVQNNGTESGIVLNDVSPETIKIIMCMYNNELYAQYVSPTASTSGGRKTRNRHKKHNKNKSGVHKPQRERQRRTIKKHIKYKCNKKTYKIDIIIQLPE
jgi:hypothetical protein